MTLPRLAALALAVVIVLALIITVAVVFIGMHRLTRYNAVYKTVRTPRVRMSELYPALKTGDIVLFVASTHSPANSMLTQTFHSHAGVVLREGDLVYLSEAQPGLELMPNVGATGGGDVHMGRGAEITPLLTRLKYYTGVFYVMRLSRRLDPGREEKVKRLAEDLRAGHYPYPSLAQIVLGVLGWRTGSRHCFQHTAHVLDQVGLTPMDREGVPLEAAGFVGVCREICGLPDRPLPDGYVYGAPHQIVYDLDTETPASDKTERNWSGGSQHTHGALDAHDVPPDNSQ